MTMVKTVRARTMVYRNTDSRMQSYGQVNPRTGHFIASLAPTKLSPGTLFDVTEDEYDSLMAAGAIEDVDPGAAPPDDLIG